MAENYLHRWRIPESNRIELSGGQFISVNGELSEMKMEID